MCVYYEFMESIASVSIKTIYSITMIYLSGVVSLSYITTRHATLMDSCYQTYSITHSYLMKCHKMGLSKNA